MRVNKRRRRQGKTDYKARLSLLTGKLPRVVVRKSNRYLTASYVTSEDAQDRVVTRASSKDLLKHGWPKENSGSLKSLPACYLTGILLAKKIKEKVKGKMILDAGLYRNTKNSRIYAALKGLVDGGLEVKHSKECLPDEKRIFGEHLKNKVNTKEIKEKILGK